jgi:single-strand DNA-binding protein
MNLNKVFLIGRLTQNPEIKTTPQGQNICSFGLATNRVWIDKQTNKKQEKTEYHNIILWGKLAETAAQYLTKGSLVFIEGRIQTRSWQDATGNRRSRTEIIAESIQLGPKKTDMFREKIEENKNAALEEIPTVEEEYYPNEEVNIPEEVLKDDNEEEIDISKIPF